MKTLFPMLFSVLLSGLLFSGCRTAPPEEAKTPSLPVEKSLSSQRREAAKKLAQAYIAGQNEALRTGSFAPLKKVLPEKLVSKKAEEIFEAMRKGLARFGALEACTYHGVLDCTFFNDFLWKYKFVRETGDPRMPRQIYEVLYRVRVIHPEEKPVIIKADFMFR